MGADMTNNWEQWEGRTVDGKFLLGKCLGGSGGSAVFRTQCRDGEVVDAALKLVAAEGADAEKQLRRWQAARELRHANLICILSSGRWAAEGREFLYVVEEYAEENLAQIVPERALTAEEARAMLVAVLGALEYVHGKGMVHGRIRPSDILATGDLIKLSSDNLRAAGEMAPAASAYDAPEVAKTGMSPASDLWSLGITLVEVLTQRLPAWDAAGVKTNAPEVGGGVPEPFRGIAQRCLEMEPSKRCGIREIRDRMEAAKAIGETIRIQEAMTSAATAAAQKERAKWPYWLALAAVIVVAALLMMRALSSSAPEGGESSAVQPTAVQRAPIESAPAQPAPQPAQKKEAAAGDGVVERVMPEVSPSARRTIQGKIRVRVRVDVDANGNVAEATLKDAGPSKYFARVALEAAKRWKFAPGRDKGEEESRAWTLLFAFSRERTEASAARAR